MKSVFIVIFAVAFVIAGGAQTKKTPRATVKSPVPAETPQKAPSPDVILEAPKKNGRPGDSIGKGPAIAIDYVPTYFFEFNRPGFIISRILIEHDSAGNGKISFLKKDLDELISDPIHLSPVTTKGIDETLAKMDFFRSTENYQYEKDLSNMGNNVIRIIKDGRERTVKFNWTTHKEAKFLMDEYRRVGNEAVWEFELASARVNQPLDTPRLLDGLDSYIQRNEISDPPHIIPLLKDINNDERLPLIARNHAARLIGRIENLRK